MRNTKQTEVLIMKDNFGNTKPVQIELNEWWFNGRIIVKQDDFRLPTWISFIDSENSSETEIHLSKSDAVKFALENPFLTPDNQPDDYIGRLFRPNVAGYCRFKRK